MSRTLRRLPSVALQWLAADSNGVSRPVWSELGELIRLSLPIIITMGSQTMMQFVDALMVAHYGRAELAAITPAGLTYFTVGTFMMGLVSCTNTFVSQSIGRGNPSECGRYTAQAVYISVASILLAIPLILLAPAIFALYGNEPQVQIHEVTYFRVIALRLAAMSTVVTLSSFFQGTGRSIIPMIAGISANVLNFLLAFLLIFGHLGLPRWGIFGAGLATTIASCFEAAILLWYYLRPAERTAYGTGHWGLPQWSRIRQLLRIGVPAGISQILDLGSWTLFIAVVIGRLGEEMQAANNAAQQIMLLSFMPVLGLNTGVTALVGRYVGKGDIPGAKRRAYLGIAGAACYMSLMGLIFLLFRHPLISAFRPEQDIIRYGGIILTYVALFQFAEAFGIISFGALKGVGDTRFPAAAQIITAWFFFIPVAFLAGNPALLARVFGSPPIDDSWRLSGLHGAWLSAVIYIWVIDAILFWRFASERWRKINIFE